MQANRFGSVPVAGPSVSIVGSLRKDYRTDRKRLVDWGLSFEGRGNAGKTAEFLLIEGYAKARLSIFEAKVGRAKSQIGLVDSTLSSGSIALSGNALGIPKVDLAIPEFYSIPILGRRLAIKGNFVHGWLGKTDIRFGNAPPKLNTRFHMLSAYGRLGKPDSPLKLYAGINHMVLWGDEQQIFGDDFTIASKKAYFYVLTGKKVVGSENISKIGNQLGSIDFGFDYDFPTVKLAVYRQHFYDKGAIRYLANLRDGLNGVSLTNKQPVTQKLQWRKLLLEVLFTKNQAGEIWSPWTPSGPEHYYNHSVYADGYSYRGRGIGTPFITPRHMAREGQASAPQDYFINNRVFLTHLGVEACYQRWTFTGKVSYSRNYGTYWTSDVEYFWFNNQRVPHDPGENVFREVGQFSAYLEGKKKLSNGYRVRYSTAFDVGNLLNNAWGGNVCVTKIFQ